MCSSADMFEGGITCPFPLSWRLLVRGVLPVASSPNDPSLHVFFPADLCNRFEPRTTR